MKNQNGIFILVAHLKKNQVGFRTKTLFGGCMTLAMIFCLSGYLAYRIYIIETTNEYTYEKRDLTYTNDQMKDWNMTLGNYNDSFNFFFGLGNPPADLDVLNNPYFEYLGLEVAIDPETKI